MPQFLGILEGGYSDDRSYSGATKAHVIGPVRYFRPFSKSGLKSGWFISIIEDIRIYFLCSKESQGASGRGQGRVFLLGVTRMLTIKNNIMSVNAARNLGRSYDALGTSVERLSSGLRINSAKDDAAGLAVRELMRADIATLKQGSASCRQWRDRCRPSTICLCG